MKLRDPMPADAKPPADDAVRAARLSRLPGVTIDEACRRFGVSRYAVRRLRRQDPARTALSLSDLVLAALTREGRDTEGTLSDLAAIAGWLDYVNHDGSRVRDVERILAELVHEGWLALEGQRWTLRRAWP